MPNKPHLAQWNDLSVPPATPSARAEWARQVVRWVSRRPNQSADLPTQLNDLPLSAWMAVMANVQTTQAQKAGEHRRWMARHAQRVATVVRDSPHDIPLLIRPEQAMHASVLALAQEQTPATDAIVHTLMAHKGTPRLLPGSIARAAWATSLRHLERGCPPPHPDRAQRIQQVMDLAHHLGAINHPDMMTTAFALGWWDWAKRVWDSAPPTFTREQWRALGLAALRSGELPPVPMMRAIMNKAGPNAISGMLLPAAVAVYDTSDMLKMMDMFDPNQDPDGAMLDAAVCSDVLILKSVLSHPKTHERVGPTSLNIVNGAQEPLSNHTRETMSILLPLCTAEQREYLVMRAVVDKKEELALLVFQSVANKQRLLRSRPQLRVECPALQAWLDKEILTASVTMPTTEPKKVRM